MTASTDSGVASPQQLLDWAETAKPGERFVYATRPFLPVGSLGAAAARDLGERGLVLLRRKRCETQPDNHVYWVLRSSRRWGVPAATAAKPVLTARSRDAGDYAAGDALLPILTRAAQHARPCPTDKQLASRAKIDFERVQPGLDALRGANAIRITSAPAPTLRRVLIVGPGWQTGLARS